MGLIVLLWPFVAKAQNNDIWHRYTPDNDTVVSLVNFYPGGEIFELEGHTALRVRMQGRDMAVSYGMFSFNEPNFVYRFVKGETDYWVGLVPWYVFENEYKRQGRRIVEHRLNMTGEQKKRLIDLLDENLRPENSVYRYNYVRDNCATRPLGIIEKAYGDSIVLGKPQGDIAGNVTFRDVMRHYHANYPWYQFGIDICLGSGIDMDLDNREKAFAPVVLDMQMPEATVGGRKIVSETVIVNDVTPDNAVSGPTPWFLTPMAVFTLFFIMVCMITARDVKRRHVSRWLDSLLFGLYGIVGLLVTFLVFCSDHEATSPNWLIFWFNPLCFLPAVCVWIKSARKLLNCYQIVNFAVLILLACAWAWTGQHANPAFVPLFLAELVRGASYIFINLKTNSQGFGPKDKKK